MEKNYDVTWRKGMTGIKKDGRGKQDLTK